MVKSIMLVVMLFIIVLFIGGCQGDNVLFYNKDVFYIINVSNLTDYNPLNWLNESNTSLLYYLLSNPLNFINASNLSATSVDERVLNSTFESNPFGWLNLSNVSLLDNQTTLDWSNITGKPTIINGTDGANGVDGVNGTWNGLAITCETGNYSWYNGTGFECSPDLQGGGVGGNPFDQNLNTTDNAMFMNFTLQSIGESVCSGTFTDCSEVTPEGQGACEVVGCTWVAEACTGTISVPCDVAMPNFCLSDPPYSFSECSMTGGISNYTIINPTNFSYNGGSVCTDTNGLCSGSGNPFDQSLNTTDEVIHTQMRAEDSVSYPNYESVLNPNAFAMMYNDGENMSVIGFGLDDWNLPSLVLLSATDGLVLYAGVDSFSYLGGDVCTDANGLCPGADFSDRVLNSTFESNPFGWLNESNASFLYYDIVNGRNFLNWTNLSNDGYVNQSYGNSTYYLLSNPLNFLNASNVSTDDSRVLNTTYQANPYAWLNTTNTSLLYYGISNPLNFVNSSNLTVLINSSVNGTYVPYTGALYNMDLGEHNFTLNGTVYWTEQTGNQTLFYINPINGDGFRMEYKYDFELANDDWLVFLKTDGNDASPDGGIAFMMQNSSNISWSVLKIDGYGLANFTYYNILTTGNVTADNLYNKTVIDVLILDRLLNSTFEANPYAWLNSSNITVDDRELNTSASTKYYPYNNTWNFINTSNLTSAVISSVNWTALTDYPVACPANNFMTQVGDAITCTSVQQILTNLTVDNNLYVVGTINESGNSLSNTYYSKNNTLNFINSSNLTDYSNRVMNTSLSNCSAGSVVTAFSTTGIPLCSAIINSSTDSNRELNTSASTKYYGRNNSEFNFINLSNLSQNPYNWLNESDASLLYQPLGSYGTSNLTIDDVSSYGNDTYLLNNGDDASRNYSFDSNTLFIDSTNDRVGVGTTSPDVPLDVVVSSNTGLRVISTAALGSGSGGSAALYASNVPTAANQRLGRFVFGVEAPNGSTYETASINAFSEEVWNDTSARGTYLRFETTIPNTTSRGERMRITGSGSVGIGTTSPNTTLHVAGDINVTSGNDICISGGNCLTAINWTTLQNYPAACAAGTAITTIGDTLTCSGINGTTTDVGTVTNTYMCYGDASSVVQCADSGVTYATGTNLITAGNLTVTTTLTGALTCTDCIDGTDLADSITLDANLAITGYNVSIDSGTLFIDSTNDRVGIGTNSPTQRLDVNGSINISSATGKLYAPIVNVTNNIQAGNYTSGDGTLGFTGTCTIIGLTNFVVKNGLIVSCS